MLFREFAVLADGTFGHSHARRVLADHLTFMISERLGDKKELIAVRDALRGPMSDDAWEERAALSFLNDYCADSLCVEFSDGDLLVNTLDEEN